jgi:uncharacterized protein (TIGR00730 family)
MSIERVCVFCGSSPGADPVYVESARALGEELARRGITLIYGGGRVGLMGAVAGATLDAGGEVIGIIPRLLMRKEVAYDDLPDLRVVGSMHERKAQMAELSDGFIALPGGFGTFEELCEIITWNQLGIYTKPIGLLNVAGYYDPLLALFDHAVNQRFVRLEHRQLVLTHTQIAPLLDEMTAYHARPLDKWIDRDAT